jgi:hypothetical protein
MKLPGSSVIAPLLLAVGMAACSSNPDMGLIDPMGSVADPGDETGSMSTQAQFLNDPVEMARTWEAAMVSLPDGQGGVIEMDTGTLESGSVAVSGPYPVVIWMHGCNGFWSGTSFRLNWLARNGFAVIAPLSLARAHYPQSCNLDTFESGLYRPTLKMRQYDAQYAIEQVRKFAWADLDNLFLAGLSEGGAVATTYTNRANPSGYLKARVAESWGCHAGWPEFVGINAPANEAVLSLLADRDPWYTADFHQGDCGEFMSATNGSQSFLVDYAPARFLHELWEQPEIQEIILNFLLQQLVRD